MFDAAREGNAELLLAAIDAGLPPNLTNPKGTFSVQFTSHTSFFWVSARYINANVISHLFF
jgi:hypothetical protein